MGCGIACKCVRSNAALTIQRLRITGVNSGKKNQKSEQQKPNFHIQFDPQTLYMNRIMRLILFVWLGKLIFFFIHLLYLVNTLEICHDRRDRRSCKILASCVNFYRKQRIFCIFRGEVLKIHLNIL